MQPIAVIAEFNINPDQVNVVLTLLKEVIQRSREEPGCLRYQLFQDDTQENIYIMIEHWENHEAWQQHVQSKHIMQAAQAIQPYLQKEIVVRSFTYVL